MSKSDALLMVMIRNARIGKVKTRLAAAVGDEKALIVYIRLLEHTAACAGSALADKAVFYSEFIEEADEFDVPLFKKYLQLGGDLGERMKNAFVKGFAQGYEKLIIIGSDCIELNTELINEAFGQLDQKDVVIGPARDGGYYLLGMKQLHPAFFTDKAWSTSNVFLDTLIDIKNAGLSVHVLPELSDVDEVTDLNEELLKLIS